MREGRARDVVFVPVFSIRMAEGGGGNFAATVLVLKKRDVPLTRKIGCNAFARVSLVALQNSTSFLFMVAGPLH